MSSHGSIEQIFAITSGSLWVSTVSKHCPDLAGLARRTAFFTSAYRDMYQKVMQLPTQDVVMYRVFLMNMAQEVANDFAVMMDLGLQHRLESGISCFVFCHY